MAGAVALSAIVLWAGLVCVRTNNGLPCASAFQPRNIYTRQ